jgi:hypothetical protein
MRASIVGVRMVGGCPRYRVQPLESVGDKSAAPPIDVIAVTRHGRFDGRVRLAIGQHQNDPQAALKLSSLIGRQRQRHMAPNSTSTASGSTSHVDRTH